MRLRRRPWNPAHAEEEAPLVGPTDALILETGAPPRESAPLPGLRLTGTQFHELPIPNGARSAIRGVGLPARPRIGHVPRTHDEEVADAAFKRMEQMLIRVNELGYAADDPMNVWERLAGFWEAAEREEKPLVSEIVRQAVGGMAAILDQLMSRLRRVLRRERDLVPLDRVQEMDQASMVWLTRQPGRTIAERAGPAQRVQAIVRRESHDTGENRVVHAWCRLADAAAQDWLRHNARAKASQRYAEVLRLQKRARLARRDLEALGVRVAPPDQTPNFVLLQDPDYRNVFESWRRLLIENRRLDELWAWQGRTWSDFCALAMTLSVRAIIGAELVASCPLDILNDQDRGAWFAADTPLAVFHLRRHGLIVEIQYRPAFVETAQAPLAAPIWLRIGDLSAQGAARRVPVWPRLVFAPVDLAEEASNCARSLAGAARALSIHNAIILHSDPDFGEAHAGERPVAAAFGIAPAGANLHQGMRAIGRVLSAEIEARRAGR